MVRAPADRSAEHGSVRRRVEELGPWFHNLRLPDGTQTAPGHVLGEDFPARKWRRLAEVLPADLSGWSALDVGCNAGFYSFELARRGARVTAIDSNPRYLEQARWAAAQYGLTGRIDLRLSQVYALAREATRYDLVLFLGVVYHLRYPLLGLDVVASKARRLLCVQSLSLREGERGVGAEDIDYDSRDRMLDPGWSKAAFVEKCFAGDPTVWWVPNGACLEGMLRSCGLRVIARPGPEIRVCSPDPEATAHRVPPWDREEYRSALGLQAAPFDGDSESGDAAEG